MLIKFILFLVHKRMILTEYYSSHKFTLFYAKDPHLFEIDIFNKTNI